MPLRTLLDLANAADQYAGALNVRNLFFCVSVQREANFASTAIRRRRSRHSEHSFLIKVFFLDLDVKENGYASTDEAMRELNAKCLAIGIPFPSVVIFQARRSTVPRRRTRASTAIGSCLSRCPLRSGVRWREHSRQRCSSTAWSSI